MQFRLPLIVLASLSLVGLSVAEPTTQKKPDRKPKYEITVDTTDVPDMSEYGQKVQAVLAEWYPKILAELPSKDFKPTRRIDVTIKNRPNGVAETSGGHIIATAKWFKDRPEDIGAFVHEVTHVAQAYTRGDRPGWLVEGIADYVRWFEFEPASKRPHPDPKKAHYDDSYQTSAHFLNYVQTKYDKHLVAELNAACREGTYSKQLWVDCTKKSLEELGEEWRRSLK